MGGVLRYKFTCGQLMQSIPAEYTVFAIKNKGGGSYEVTIQDIITERIYWRQFKTKSNFDRYFTILFEVEKKLRGGEFTLLTLV